MKAIQCQRIFKPKKESVDTDSFAWPFHTRLQFNFFGVRGFFRPVQRVLFFHFEHMNAIAVAYEYVMTLYFFSLFQHFFHSHIYPLVRALRHIDFRFAVYRYSRDECGEALSNGSAHTFLSCIVLSAEFIIILLLSTRVRHAFTFYFRRIHLMLFVWLLYIRSNGKLTTECHFNILLGQKVKLAHTKKNLIFGTLCSD